MNDTPAHTFTQPRYREVLNPPRTQPAPKPDSHKRQTKETSKRRDIDWPRAALGQEAGWSAGACDYDPDRPGAAVRVVVATATPARRLGHSCTTTPIPGQSAILPPVNFTSSPLNSSYHPPPVLSAARPSRAQVASGVTCHRRYSCRGTGFRRRHGQPIHQCRHTRARA